MGKINSIIVDNWKKLGLVFGNVVGIVEIVNAKAVALLLAYISKTLVTAHKWKSDVIKVKSWSMDSLHTTMVSAHRMQDSWIESRPQESEACNSIAIWDDKLVCYVLHIELMYTLIGEYAVGEQISGQVLPSFLPEWVFGTKKILSLREEGLVSKGWHANLQCIPIVIGLDEWLGQYNSKTRQHHADKRWSVFSLSSLMSTIE